MSHWGFIGLELRDQNIFKIINLLQEDDVLTPNTDQDNLSSQSSNLKDLIDLSY